MLKNIIVTSGGTEEYIDDVRVITNISTGKLGLLIANKLSELSGVRVFYVCSRTAEKPRHPPNNLIVREIRTAADAFKTLNTLMVENSIHSVVHAMAVSDFAFDNRVAVKLKSDDPISFIEFLKAKIRMNPKIIKYFKKWSYSTLLIGFKFEVGISNEELIQLAGDSIKKNGCDLVIANDKKEMQENKSHIAHFVFSEEMKNRFKMNNCKALDKSSIALRVVEFITKSLG